MSKRIALVFLTLASPMVIACFFIDHSVSRWLFSLLSMSFPIALIALGGQREGRLGPLRLPLTALWLLLTGSASALLLLTGNTMRVPFLAGFPLSAAVMLGVLWLAPLLLVGGAYAASFDSFTLTESDLRRFEELRSRDSEEQS